ncbi:hypothetical protein MKW98_018753 [Papaver atlanticum]|uniref:Uncharacterized protein n=1 Tax=Papaver atlanticum TaxID=357466 RepID=A0AAD4XQI0_9MAGN|nr:hypothetical protein MKW98_018753 [Papaver atlanticum]
MKIQKQVTEAKDKYKETGASGSKSCLISEPLEDVFGANRKDCIRGYSSRMSKKQAEMAAALLHLMKANVSAPESSTNPPRRVTPSPEKGSTTHPVGGRHHVLEEEIVSATILWDAPQGDNYFFLKQLPLPTWVKWSEERMQPTISETF